MSEGGILTYQWGPADPGPAIHPRREGIYGA